MPAWLWPSESTRSCIIQVFVTFKSENVITESYLVNCGPDSNENAVAQRALHYIDFSSIS